MIAVTVKNGENTLVENDVHRVDNMLGLFEEMDEAVKAEIDRFHKITEQSEEEAPAQDPHLSM